MTKDERAASGKAYYEAHKAEKAAYYEAHKAEIAAYMKAYREAHKAEIAASGKVYREANPDKILDKLARRRARKRGATVVEKVSRVVVYERDAGKCHICVKKAPKRGWHLDHIIPLVRGGEHSYQNVAVACPKCNMRKQAKAGGQLRLI